MYYSNILNFKYLKDEDIEIFIIKNGIILYYGPISKCTEEVRKNVIEKNEYIYIPDYIYHFLLFKFSMSDLKNNMVLQYLNINENEMMDLVGLRLFELTTTQNMYDINFMSVTAKLMNINFHSILNFLYNKKYKIDINIDEDDLSQILQIYDDMKEKHQKYIIDQSRKRFEQREQERLALEAENLRRAEEMQTLFEQRTKELEKERLKKEQQKKMEEERLRQQREQERLAILAENMRRAKECEEKRKEEQRLAHERLIQQNRQAKAVYHGLMTLEQDDFHYTTIQAIKEAYFDEFGEFIEIDLY